MKFYRKYFGNLTQRHSIFAICFVSYLAVLLFSIFFNIYNYNAYMNNLYEQKRLYDEVMFQQFDEMICGELNRVDTLLVNVLTSTDILKVVSASDLVSSRQLSQTLRASVQMRNYSNKVQISGMYIYFANGDAIIMDGAYYKPQEFYRKFVDTARIDYDDWCAKLHQNHYRSYEKSTAKGADELALYHTINGGAPGKDALVVIQFSLHDIFNIFKDSFFAGQMSFLITDSNGQPLENYGEADFSNVHQHQIAPYKSERTGWTYYSAIPAKVYDSTANALILRTTLVLLAELLIGILLCFLFARTNTMPIRKLYRRLTGSGQKLTDEVRNEYNFVNSCFDSLMKEKDQLLRQHNQVMRNNLLMSILNNKMTLQEVEEDYLFRLGIDFSSKSFQVLNILIEYGNDLPGDNCLESQSLMKYHLVKLLSDSFQKDFHPCVVDVSWNQMAVIFNGDGLDHLLDPLYRRLVSIKNCFETEFSSYLTIGIGGVYDSFEEISRSNQESIAALEYKILEGQGAVCAYKDIGARKSNQYFYPTIDKAKIKAKIRSGDAEGATATLNQVFSDIFSNRVDIPLEVAKCLFFDIMGMGLEVLSEIRSDRQDACPNYMELLFGCKTIEQLQVTLNRILEEICASIKKSQTSHNQQLLDRIYDYIGKHCYDSNFSLVSMADSLGITPPYLSGFFKEKTGGNLVDYITSLRMSMAKELLRRTDLTVAEIAVRVRYGSSGTFIRSFKKLEGVTPAQYREAHARQAM